MTCLIRPGRDSDAQSFIRLIGDSWSEYPNCILDVDGENPELKALATYFAHAQGMLWAAEDEGQITGMIGTKPTQHDEAWEISRVYVRPERRGSGLAHKLLDTAERFASEAGAARLVLWTDTRFDAAHAFYEKRGYVRSGSIRILDDASKSLEFRYAKPLRDLTVEILDAAAASSAERRLMQISQDAHDAGRENTGHYAPAERTKEYWRKVSSDAAVGKCLLLAAWLDGQMMGTIQIRLAQTAQTRHRAELTDLLIHPSAGARGLDVALIQRAEQAARGIGRQLISARILEDSKLQSLFLGGDWTLGGRLPDYVRDGPGEGRAILFFWKSLQVSTAQ
ncbi:GNAT family N-acetyltransferase [Roseomonas elaeocarpi]|uniref:GNAT family N-acetyltransferase n=1 Tax=Roseomonas elaeocarpi TaxID=907779 RepID=A0ABV6JQI7_9PROT